MKSHVIVQIENVGAFRAPAAEVADVLEVNRDDGNDVYIVDPHGNLWAPGPDCWYLWCKNTDAFDVRPA
jgi:hypothetical protein